MQEKFGNVCAKQIFDVNLQRNQKPKQTNAMNTNEKTWTVQPKIHNGKYGKNVYNNQAYAEFVKETLCKDTGFEWVIIEK